MLPSVLFGVVVFSALSCLGMFRVERSRRIRAEANERELREAASIYEPRLAAANAELERIKTARSAAAREGWLTRLANKVPAAPAAKEDVK